MMPVRRNFLGWNAPLTKKVCKFLLPQKPHGPVDMGNELILVPTRQAGRRLREALAKHCAEHNTALLSPCVETPGDFLRRGQANAPSKTEIAAIWATILMQTDLKGLPGLFPTHTPQKDFPWALQTGKILQNLRDELADGGHRITDVYQKFGDQLEELERWRDLAELETTYLKRLGELGKHDPIELMIRQSEKPQLPQGIKRIVIAAISDPSPLIITALENLDQKIIIDILIHAPESLADQFDPWGRPIPERWRTSRIDIPDQETNIILAGSPVSQSQKALHLMTIEKERFGPADIAIGVPDSSVSPHLMADLKDKGLPSFDPSGKPVAQHPLFQLLDSFHALLAEGGYKPFSTLLRHSDILERLRLSPHRLLEELDRFQNQYLPIGWEQIAEHFAKNAAPEFETLGKAVNFVKGLIKHFESDDLNSAMRSLLEMIYEVRSINPSKPEDEEFIAVANLIDSTLAEFESPVINSLRLGKKEELRLFLQRLGEQRYPLERQHALIDLEGWLELEWNDAPFLIITGMNEGIVPASRLSDIFLPDSLRTLLKLRSDAQLLTTDIYSLSELIESRRSEGRVSFIVGKTSGSGDPLKPSRLLFHCDDADLPRRAERLFGDPDERRDNHPPAISFRLNAGADLKPVSKMEKMSVTQFKDYLACPFRFYLKHSLGMEALDDQKTELDALDFGSLVHHALRQMAHSLKMRRCENERELANFLSQEAQTWIRERFGATPPLQIEIQLLSAMQRLEAAARVQAELVGQGWEIQQSEWRVEISLKGITISGRIDRLDRNLHTGHLRIIDYKTSEKAQKPEAAHLFSRSVDARDYARIFIGEKEKRWGDLQLPLYRLMLPDSFADPVELGYFNLPKATNETGLMLWGDFNNKLLTSAKGCAEGVIEDIQNNRFWPPARKVQYDNFEALFPAAVEDCVEFNL